MISALIRNGHNRVWEYGYSFALEAHAEIGKSRRAEWVDMASAMRVHNIPNDDWKKMMDEYIPKPKKVEGRKPKKVMTADEHRAVIARLKGL